MQGSTSPPPVDAGLRDLAAVPFAPPPTLDNATAAALSLAAQNQLFMELSASLLALQGTSRGTDGREPRTLEALSALADLADQGPFLAQPFAPPGAPAAIQQPTQRTAPPARAVKTAPGHCSVRQRRDTRSGTTDNGSSDDGAPGGGEPQPGDEAHSWELPVRQVMQVPARVHARRSGPVAALAAGPAPDADQQQQMVDGASAHAHDVATQLLYRRV